MTHSAPQHHRPEYLAGQIRTLVIVVARIAKHAKITRDIDDLLCQVRDHSEQELEGREQFIDYHTGCLHAAEQVREELY